ncbi:MAG: glutamate--tRNA ligase [Candidatus Atribacteria bacterium]|nr:glutamate--tRNA ligase [Candidatus Atribacteria bacterium]
MDPKPVRTRFAPSPTGRMHLGSARSALYPFLLARRTGGTFILRIEDTDQKRFVPGAEQELIDGLHWLGINYDEGPDVGGPCGPYRQTERREIYHKYAWKLVELGHAFPCFCTPDRLDKVRQEQMKNKQNPRYDGACRNLNPDEGRRRAASGEKYVIRFKMPKEGSITTTDFLRGPSTTENSALDDSVLLKSDGLPTYHLAAMVDDHLMEITHVIRGSEWLPSLPLHTHIIRAFGWEEPQFVHLSVFLKPSGKGKMSKRETAEAIQDGHSIFVSDMQSLGYIPEGVLNWIALMGWGVSEGDVLTLDDMIARFDIHNLTPSPAAMNFAKLDHFNATHIRLLRTDDLAARVKPYFLREGLAVDDAKLLKIVPLVRERLVTLDDCLPFAAWFFKETVEPKPADLVAKNLTAAQSADVARKAYEILAALPDITPATAEPPMRLLVERLGLSPNQVFGILRVAVTGQTVSPPLFESMEIVGKEKVLEQVKKAIVILERT